MGQKTNGKRIGKIVGFAVIAPHAIRKMAIAHSSIHMMLAQVQDSKYWDDFANACGYKILDNGFFELGYSLEKEMLLAKGLRGKANCIVLQDGEYKDMDFFMKEGFHVMLVPTSVEQAVEFLHISHSHPEYEVKVGLSHIHAAKALKRRKFDVANRYKFLGNIITEYKMKFGDEAKQTLFRRTLGGYAIHLLGLGHYPYAELKMMSELCKFTCDSNSFIWPYYHNPCAYNMFGRITTKYKESLDFDYVNPQIQPFAINKQLEIVKNMLSNI